MDAQGESNPLASITDTMISRQSTERPWKRFYEVLVLLLILGQVQGDRISGQPLDDENLGSIEAMGIRRKVMYHLCVMCDFLKGGDTVTAMASEDLPQGPRYWVAANSLLAEEIKPFLLEVLQSLETMAMSNEPHDTWLTFERCLFEKFVAFHQKRIRKYWSLLQGCIRRELDRIPSSLQAHNYPNEYVAWLRRFQDRPVDAGDFCSLSDHAYSSRHSEFLRVDFDPVFAQPMRLQNLSRPIIRHYIGRLCAPMRAARLLTYAAANYPFMFDGFSIECLVPETPSARPSEDALLTLDGISKRMFRVDEPEMRAFREALQRLDSTGSIMSRILDRYRDENWQPRIHAEVALLEVVHGAGILFFDGDKTIACSKPACFCCYHYLCSHPGSFTRPQCHNKVYINWQPPKLTTDCNAVRMKQQRDVMDKVTQQVRAAVIDKVLGAERGRTSHPDSTTGITPVSQSALQLVMTPRNLADNLEGGNPGQSLLESGGQDSETEDSEDGGVALECVGPE